MINTILDFIWRSTRTFYPFERIVLEAVANALSSEIGIKFRKQIDVVNSVQRLAGGIEVNLYQKRNGKVDFDESLRFRGVIDEFILARIKIRWPSSPRLLGVRVWVVAGHVFSLEFSESPKKFFAETALSSVRPEIAHVEVYTEHLPP